MRVHVCDSYDRLECQWNGGTGSSILSLDSVQMLGRIRTKVPLFCLNSLSSYLHVRFSCLEFIGRLSFIPSEDEEEFWVAAVGDAAAGSGFIGLTRSSRSALICGAIRTSTSAVMSAQTGKASQVIADKLAAPADAADLVLRQNRGGAHQNCDLFVVLNTPARFRTVVPLKLSWSFCSMYRM